MSDESLDIGEFDRDAEAASRGDVRDSTHERGRAPRATREPSETWGWIGNHSSYDWMDSHGPFTADLNG